jgi:NADH dehydrogenase
MSTSDGVTWKDMKTEEETTVGSRTARSGPPVLPPARWASMVTDQIDGVDADRAGRVPVEQATSPSRCPQGHLRHR